MIGGETEPEVLAREIVEASLAVHRALGPGLLESVYEQCLVHELAQRGVPTARQVVLPLIYRDLRIEAGFRMDLVVGGLVVVELKSVEVLLPVHRSQVLTYLKLSGLRIGFLINFNVTLIKHGLHRLVL
jgi:GxxExxY protein